MSKQATCGICNRPFQAGEKICPVCIVKLHADIRKVFKSGVADKATVIQGWHAQAMEWVEELEAIFAANAMLPFTIEQKNIVIARAVALQASAGSNVAMVNAAGIDTALLQTTNQGDIDDYHNAFARAWL